MSLRNLSTNFSPKVTLARVPLYSLLLDLKKGGELRFCVGHIALDKETALNWFPIPHTDFLIDKIQGSRIFFTRLRIRRLELTPAYPQDCFFHPIWSF